MTRASIVALCLFAAGARAGDGAPHSAAQANAWKQEKEVRAHARRILLALQNGDAESLADECVMYDATANDRRALSRKYLEENKSALQAAARTADVNAADFAKDLEFSAPNPAAGMPGRVTIPFGPEVAAPANKQLFPSRHELELSWSGPLMPEANGPVHATPPPGSKRGRWRFYQVVMPYSQTPSQLL